MVKKIKNLIRHYWHDLYFSSSSQRISEFALSCKHVAELIDLHEPKSISKKIQLWLHLSLCQACANYALASKTIKSLVLDSFKNENQKKLKLDEFNQKVLKKFSK